MEGIHPMLTTTVRQLFDHFQLTLVEPSDNPQDLYKDADRTGQDAIASPDQAKEQAKDTITELASTITDSPTVPSQRGALSATATGVDPAALADGRTLQNETGLESVLQQPNASQTREIDLMARATRERPMDMNNATQTEGNAAAGLGGDALGTAGVHEVVTGINGGTQHADAMSINHVLRSNSSIDGSAPVTIDMDSDNTPPSNSASPPNPFAQGATWPNGLEAAARGATVPVARHDVDATSAFDVDMTGYEDARIPGRAQAASLDLVNYIKGMYRILDLVSEPGSGGLVDKIIIAQESFGRFANSICPGSYQSMTHVKFTDLDAFSVKPLGLYGSKSEIVQFLKDLEVVDDEIARQLNESKDDSFSANQPVLRSGLYFLRDPAQESIVYVVYWPEDTTWDDNAISSVQRNRVTFMRYLTKITDQVIALISEEHANALVWADAEDYNMDCDEDETDRLYTFEVSKTKEQEESVSTRPGFKIQHQGIRMPPVLEDDPLPIEAYIPRVVQGETCVGFLTATYSPPRTQSLPHKEFMNSVRLRSLISKESFQLDPDLPESALEILFRHGLRERAPEAVRVLEEQRSSTKDSIKAELEETKKEMNDALQEQNVALVKALSEELARAITDRFKVLNMDLLSKAQAGDRSHTSEQAAELLANFTAIHPMLRRLRKAHRDDPKLWTIASKSYTDCKGRLLHLQSRFDSTPGISASTQELLIEAAESERKPDSDWQRHGAWGKFASAASSFVPSNMFGQREPHERIPSIADDDFLNTLPAVVSKYPALATLADRAITLAHLHFSSQIMKGVSKAVGRLEVDQRSECQKQSQLYLDQQMKTIEEISRTEFLQAVRESFITDHRRIFVVKNATNNDSHHSRYHYGSWQNSPQYVVIGTEMVESHPSVQHTVRVLQLTENDKAAMQLESTSIPTPKVFDHSAFKFDLPTSYRMVHIQLLDSTRCLLATGDQEGNIMVYLEQMRDIGAAVTNRRTRKHIHSEKIGKDVLMAYDEAKRMLAVCAAQKLTLHIFVFDEHYTTLQGYGSTVDLKPWYDPDPQMRLLSMVFRGGNHEELALLDQSSRIRSYSFATQQFRPASVQLQRGDLKLLSAPDGSCLFAAEPRADSVYLQSYHWSSFGSTAGISLELPISSADSFAVTSFLSRSRCHFVSLSTSEHSLQSAVLDITHKITEFTFKADQGNERKSTGVTAGVHNSLIDCHRDVWTRFPVITAVQRHTNNLENRQPRAVTFVSPLDPGLFRNYFSELITAFQSTTRKPTEGVLDGIKVSGMTYRAFLKQAEQNLSLFRVGDWLVHTTCLIPIHLAVARDNRFVPLKDGVWSADQERSLLGATVDQVIDNLTFGWYESIFRSYMASKPVRVVSSMGEQSVGKSFALNHLVDTSFAGSAMRTTEGVWMSVTPTDQALIVALDFEGVHSIERSAQEDSLLVLFNTAVSNLVLFRNNFALSRDITGSFQSFQSSATVLDPALNPSLFKSTLVIIIKDVVDSDKKEITKEFSLKFQRIVEVEQESNFITRLHSGKLAIIPWPVIESKQFYTLFPTLKKMLDKQVVTHPKAGIFLQTMKTLMAKLKTNDWGALDQNLASHRVQQLLRMLPSALRYGAVEVDPEIDPLKNLDSGALIDLPDTDAQFYLPSEDAIEQVSQERCLLKLQGRWERFTARHDEGEAIWVDALTAYLAELARLRIEHVQEWLSVNMARFASDNTVFDTIRRSFEAMVVNIRVGIQICKIQCTECQLLCLLGRHHDGHHDCRTDHRCPRTCQFEDEHAGAVESCGLPAGHTGTHICEISAHLCAQPCRLLGRAGCLERCAKIINHPEEEHLCPAQSHACGMPCSLTNVRFADGTVFNCQEACCISSELPHTAHVCKNQSCPLPCQLCKRLCATPDHLHGLDPGVSHLCGQEHMCSALCQSTGICRIETAPQSVEATFTGRHESFQYTKYSQVSKRLPCVILIPPGETEHQGKHSHNQDANAFHFCEARCENCGYFCTLPLGHPQQEHETSHGSMSKTRWAIDGPDGTVFEVNGRKFGSNDDGAPMLCSMLCRNLGRHVHIDYCRSSDAQCRGAGLQHINVPMLPNPDRAKDFISHDLSWRRTGFKDPYSQEDRTDFAKCDRMCGGPEHQADANNPATPSYCNAPIFHQPLPAGPPPGGVGYVSSDGHHFSCRNPAQLQQAFHVVFVIDRSGSMGLNDHRPLRDTPVTARIAGQHDNRIGAVYSSLYAFWTARPAPPNGTAARRDAYSVILFDHSVINSISNDFVSTPDALLQQVLRYGADGGTNYTAALRAAQACIESHWSTERSPVVIFLSDGECQVGDSVTRDLCRRAVALGRPLSFHAVSFGPRNQVLRRMVQIANEVERGVPADPMRPLVPSSYAEALDSVRLAETFLGIAESLKKPRGGLMKA